jgi:pyridoxal biosynthesis lyase PdxS
MLHGTEVLKKGFAKMTKGGVIMDVVNAEQAAIAEDAGAVSVMALEKVPADIRAAGGVARHGISKITAYFRDYFRIVVVVCGFHYGVGY